MFIVSMYIRGMGTRRIHTVGYLIWLLSTKWRVAVDRALKPLGLTHAHYLLIGALHEFSRSGAKPSQRELADFAGLEVMYVSKLVRPLERAGLLRRADHHADPRAFQVELTAAGTDLVGQAAAVMRELFDQLLLPIGGRSSKRAAALMRTINALLDEGEAFNRTDSQTTRVNERGRRRR
jgi:MarR family transcriptional regulator, organic hydroperoxide resistance regulator